jgi:hypothetical protein
MAMKKIFTISSFLILSIVLLSGCVKRSYYDDTDYWLSKENGIVVYSDNFCPYYVIETYNGYTIVRATGGITPYEGDEIYGNLSGRGYKDLFNYSANTIIRGEITDYWLTYGEAQYLIDNLCYTYGRGGEKKQIRTDLKKPVK